MPHKQWLQVFKLGEKSGYNHWLVTSSPKTSAKEFKDLLALLATALPCMKRPVNWSKDVKINLT